ncbi:MAG TPA: N-6 DNA methylase [Micromonospora sp.]
MPHRSAQVTAADIARLAGVTRATVSNWRRRHPDFPAPVGGSDASPTYDLAAVRAWLASRGQLPTESAADDLRAAIRTPPADATTPGRLLPLVRAVAWGDEVELTALLELPDDELARRAHKLVRPHAADIPGADGVSYGVDEAGLIRALLRCIHTEGARAALDVLAERALETSDAAGAYETPEPLATLMAGLLTRPDQTYPTSVFDPACGAGHLLVAAAVRGARELYGQDVVPTQAAQAAVRLHLAAPHATAQLRSGDSLRADAFQSLTVEAVLCAPPYGDRSWGHEELAYDPRWVYGLPPRGEPELAWVQHCLAHLRPGGVAVLLMPPATAERPAGRRIRGELLRRGALRAVVALPAGIAAPFHIGLQLWVLHRPGPDSPVPQQVLFVDTTGDGHATQSDQKTTVDWSRLHQVVLEAWSSFAADPDGFESMAGTARAVPVTDLLDETIDLTPARLVRAVPTTTRPADVAESVRALCDRLRTSIAELTEASTILDWAPAGAVARSWRTATVARTCCAVGRSPSCVRGVTERASPRKKWRSRRGTSSCLSCCTLPRTPPGSPKPATPAHRSTDTCACCAPIRPVLIHGFSPDFWVLIRIDRRRRRAPRLSGSISGGYGFRCCRWRSSAAMARRFDA